MKLIKKTPEKVIFIEKTNESLINSIRRSVGLIPIMATDELEISKNDSALYDETIAHRLGLIPIKMEKSWKEDTVLKLKLNVKKEGFVYSGDIKGECEFVHDKIPITLLKKDQELKIKATTKMGLGKNHAKFSPGILFYRNLNEITMDKSFEEEIRKIFLDANISTKGDKIIIKDEGEKSLLDFCEGLAVKNKKKIEIKDTGEIVVTIESFGQISAEEIFKKSIEALKKRLKEVKLK
jgi:DNA-directed RNA polymerase subunit D